MEMKHSVADLEAMQSLSLPQKELMSADRIKAWVNSFGQDNCYISFSGGKDSTVLAHLVKSIFPDIPAVFSDTGLEYPELRQFALKHADIVVKPKMNFRDVIYKYGYPLISKEQSDFINKFKRTKSDYFAHSLLYGLKRDGTKSKFVIAKKNVPLIYAPFDVNVKCCEIMKKKPLSDYQKQSGRKPFIGTLAEESRYRKQWWMKRGCNVYEGSRQNSSPLSFWTEQDILKYIVDKNLEIPSVYGNIVPENGSSQLITTGVNRTGCIYCGFGLSKDGCPNRFQLLKQTHPKLWNYCINGGSNSGEDGKWRPTKDGLGMWKVLDYIGVPYE